MEKETLEITKEEKNALLDIMGYINRKPSAHWQERFAPLKALYGKLLSGIKVVHVHTDD